MATLRTTVWSIALVATLVVPVGREPIALADNPSPVELASEPIAESSTQPNFVLVVTDDQRWDTVGRCLPEFDPFDFSAGADACMPNLQNLLMSTGTTFLQGNVTQSLCCPSRASILTGQYSENSGVTYNNANLLDDTSTIATWLDDAGYRNGLFGKYLNGYGVGPLAEHIPPGWEAFATYHAYSNSDNPYTDYPWISWEEGDEAPVVTRIDADDSTSSDACADGNFYSTDYFCNLALDFLQDDVTTPFFVHLGPATPHLPLTLPERHAGVFSSVDTPPYPSTNVLPFPNPPSYLPPNDLSQRHLDRIERNLQDAMEMTLTVDDMIGALHSQLVADGRIDNTVWIFISDNGVANGEQHWRNKGCEYRSCHQVPFVVACPTGICPGAIPGNVDGDNFALNIDIAPTIAELAGASPTIGIDGMSLVPLLSNPQAAWRTEWFMYGYSPRYEGIVGVGTDGDWYKYVEHVEDDEFELFNLVTDEWEIANLAGDAAYAGVEADLAARLEAHRTGEPPPSNVDPVAAFSWSCVDLDCVFADESSDLDGSVVSWDWDFGDGVGVSVVESPSYSFGGGGTYSVSLTVVDDDGGSGVVLHDVTVTDPVGGDGAFIESDGQVVLESESYFTSITRSGDTWTEITDPTGFSGIGAMQALPDDGTRLRTDLAVLSPELTFDVEFATTGTFYIWLRTYAPDVRGKAAFVGIDGVPAGAGIAAGGSGAWGDGVGEWSWSNTGRTGAAVSFEVGSAGVHTVNLWMGDDGIIVDKIVATTEAGFVPTDLGPPESPRALL